MRYPADRVASASSTVAGNLVDRLALMEGEVHQPPSYSP